MPKNEKGDYVCINHESELLTNMTFVNLPKLDFDSETKKLNESSQSFPAKLMFCPECGYIEFYTIKPEQDFPDHNAEQ
ncbi:hypothetical protein SD427_08090 [Chryseobacterium sp. JJR-5R]|uniref:hypothetical protein n=1 Tax=Chryseobacterium sp. JJR-5R TaxID=3093923 RepID=UPI002A75A1D1|nr:hypothetical protein [Chryseobacterium sp. JJR-5R]WPO84282.1 hypothetical protein SD427_08090 [Chryseobacterium sp. JJR-5R]